MATLSTLGDIQRKRAEAFPEKLSENPLRATILEGFHRRNAFLDAVFYDVGVITEDENKLLAKQLAREGAIVVVPPTGEEPLALYQDVAAFVAAEERVAALAVAGVGNSALGAAAFARNVADAVGGKVAAVVSGYGLSDLLTEAIGGHFLFGQLNSLRHLLEPLDIFTKALGRDQHSLEWESGVALARSSKDTRTVLELLKHPGFTGTLLIGHSKGNLVLSEAL